MQKKGIYERRFKRPLDFTLALFSLIVLIPLIIVISIIVRIKLGSPIIFKQKRPGYKEKIFVLYKFRTMTDEKGKNGDLLPDSERLTKFGKFLRSTSIDELPSLLNIISGKLSLVGPRPLAVKYLPFYTEYERQRHLVRPGLSGLAQVNGRNSIKWEKKFQYDINYAKNITFKGDLKIIFKSLIKILSRQNIGERGISGHIDFDKYRERKLV
ncbi:sugar transferase [Mycoplasmatota bacterium WC30]